MKTTLKERIRQQYIKSSIEGYYVKGWNSALDKVIQLFDESSNGISKSEETNRLIDTMTEFQRQGNDVDYEVLWADIAKSLAIIADKL